MGAAERRSGDDEPEGVGAPTEEDREAGGGESGGEWVDDGGAAEVDGDAGHEAEGGDGDAVEGGSGPGGSSEPADEGLEGGHHHERGQEDPGGGDQSGGDPAEEVPDEVAPRDRRRR